MSKKKEQVFCFHEKPLLPDNRINHKGYAGFATLDGKEVNLIIDIYKCGCCHYEISELTQAEEWQDRKWIILKSGVMKCEPNKQFDKIEPMFGNVDKSAFVLLEDKRVFVKDEWYLP